jgi:hypothetical protein
MDPQDLVSEQANVFAHGDRKEETGGRWRVRETRNEKSRLNSDLKKVVIIVYQILRASAKDYPEIWRAAEHIYRLGLDPG